MQTVAAGRFSLAARDIREGISSVHLWPMLGWTEIKQRYRRSMIGPFWLTISYGVMVAAMGPLYGRLFQQDAAVYFPYFAIGFVCWLFIQSLITDGCSAFIAAEGMLKQTKLPLTVHVLREVWKNLIIFAHNLAIVVAVLYFYWPGLTWHMVLVPFGVLVVAINGVWFGLLFGLLCARFRDIPLVISSLVQVAFFLTPIMWRPEMLRGYQWAAEWNPLFHFLEIIRAPILEHTAAARSWAIVLGITLVGISCTFLVFSRFRARIAYWV